MASKAQTRANRENAKRSTGPRTEEGKARSSQNSLKHGLLARDAVLPGEDPTEFDRQLSTLEDEIRPANSLEFALVRQIVDTEYRLRRLGRLESGFLGARLAETSRIERKYNPERVRPGYEGETQLLGQSLRDCTQALAHLARYDAQLRRGFFCAVKQLVGLRLEERQSRERYAEARQQAEAAQDPYRGRRYVPAQAPPPVASTNPEEPNIGFRPGPSPTSHQQGGARLSRAALSLRPTVRRASNEPTVGRAGKLRHGPNPAEPPWNQGGSPQSVPASAQPSRTATRCGPPICLEGAKICTPIEKYGTPNASERSHRRSRIERECDPRHSSYQRDSPHRSPRPS